MKGKLIHLLGDPNWRFCQGQRCKSVNVEVKKTLKTLIRNWHCLEIITVAQCI